MKNKLVIFFINGVMSNPGDAFAWTDRATAWTNQNTPWKAEKFEYFSPVMLRFLYQNERVEKLAKAIRPYLLQKFNVWLVGHSNGADIICRLLNKENMSFLGITLVAGATDADCNKNGINKAIIENRLQSANFYCSHADEILKRVGWTKKLFGWMGLGYGNIGFVGPDHILESTAQNIGITWKRIGHCAWFAEHNFVDMMESMARTIKKYAS